MNTVIEKEFEHLGETSACEDCDRDLLRELSRRVDAVWHYDQYIANADGHSGIQHYWRDMKVQELNNIARLKSLLKVQVNHPSF